MQVVLVGPAASRVRLRAALDDTGVEVVAEWDTLAEAREAALEAGLTAGASAEADLWLLAVDDGSELAVRRDVRGARGARGSEEALPEHLTPRELEVLTLMADGLANRAIADRLGISDQTVKFHVASIFGKLGAINRTDAVRRAIRRGIVSL